VKAKIYPFNHNLKGKKYTSIGMQNNSCFSCSLRPKAIDFVSQRAFCLNGMERDGTQIVFLKK